MVKFPALEIVPLWEAKTPLAKNAVVPPPAERLPVEVRGEAGGAVMLKALLSVPNPPPEAGGGRELVVSS